MKRIIGVFLIVMLMAATLVAHPGPAFAESEGPLPGDDGFVLTDESAGDQAGGTTGEEANGTGGAGNNGDAGDALGDGGGSVGDGSGSAGAGGEAGQPDEGLPGVGNAEGDGSAVDESVAAEDDVFPGMPSGYRISANERGKKAKLASDGVLDSFKETTADEDYVDGEVVILAGSREEAEMIAEAYGGELESFSYGVAVASLPEDASTFDAIEAAADPTSNLPAVYPNFLYSLPDQIVEKPITSGGGSGGVSAFAAPVPVKQGWSPTFSDPYLKNPGAGVANVTATNGYQWFHEAIGTYAAWGTTMGAGVTVAVVDTGVQSAHPDLSGNMITPGYTAIAGTTTAGDDQGHGTHVAGIIAAMANSVGGRGVAPSAKILPVKVLDSKGGGTTSSIVAGLNWVVSQRWTANNADVINMSLGGFDFDTPFLNAVTDAINAGIVVVAAAGNDGTNNYRSPGTLPGVICVASTDMNGYRSNFSNYGDKITIAAPGSSILSTYPTQNPSGTAMKSGIGVTGYEVMSGTSMATPAVAGVAALYISAQTTKPNNAAGVAGVKNALVNTANKAGSASIGKIVSAGNLFNAPSPVPVIAVWDGSGVGVHPRLVTTALIPNNGSVTIEGANYIVYTTNGKNPAISNGAVTSGTGVDGSESPVVLDLSKFPVGKLVIKAICVNTQGVASKVATVTITTVNVAPVDLGGGGFLGDSASTGGMSPITGPAYLAIGKAATYAAKVVTGIAPAGTNKTLVWSIAGYNNYSGTAQCTMVNGKLTIKKGAPGDQVIIRADAKGSAVDSVYSTYTVTIMPLIKKMTVAPQGGVNVLYTGVTSPGALPAVPTAQGSVQLSLDVTYNGDATVYDLTGELGYVTWKTSNKNIATVDAYGNVTAKGKGNVTITATATDGSARAAKTTIKCMLPATAVRITGNNQQIAIGKTLTLKAPTTPASPTAGGVTWGIESSLGEPDTRITINSNGKITIQNDPDLIGETITVTATAKGAYGVTTVFAKTDDIEIVAKMTTKVTLSTTQSYLRTAKTGAAVVQGNASKAVPGSVNANVTAVQLFTLNPPSMTAFDANAGYNAAAVDETKIALTGTAFSGSASKSDAALIWSSSKPAIADVDQDGNVEAYGVGKAVITCKASDGSGKLAKCTVTVGVPVSSVWVQGKKTLTTYSQPSLAFGRALQMNAAPYSAYGKASNAKVKWTASLQVATYTWYVPDPVNNPTSGYYVISGYSAPTKTAASKVSISSAGKLSVKANMFNDRVALGGGGTNYFQEFAVLVTATAIDGSGVTGSQYVNLCVRTDKMGFYAGASGIYSEPYVDSLGNDCFDNYLKYKYGYADKGSYAFYGNWLGDYIVTSSNPAVAAIDDYYDAGSTFGYIYIEALSPGKAMIKIVSNDGSNLAASRTITVYADPDYPGLLRIK